MHDPVHTQKPADVRRQSVNAKAAAKEARLKAALRSNLKRRKAMSVQPGDGLELKPALTDNE